MFGTPAHAQTTTPAADGGMGMLIQFAPIIGLFALMYFLMIRPQQRRMKEHQQLITNIKRGDTVVLSSGIIGKVTKVEDKEVQVEIAPTVTVKVVKATITEVRAKGEPAPANDPKS